MKALSPKFLLNVTNSPVSLRASSNVAIGAFNIVNPNAAISYVQLFDALAANAVTLGTTLPTAWLAVAANGVLSDSFPGNGVEFPNGIVIAATTTPTGNTAPSSALNVQFFTRE